MDIVLEEVVEPVWVRVKEGVIVKEDVLVCVVVVVIVLDLVVDGVLV
jgi:hypothetical protein